MEGTPEKQEIQFNVLFQFLRNSYIEVPRMMRNQKVALDTSVDIEVQHKRLNDVTYEVILVSRYNVTSKHKQSEDLESEATVQESDNIIHLVGSVSYAFIVEISQQSDEELDVEAVSYCLNVEIPYLIFPYNRHLISFMTSNCGFPPLNLIPVNFKQSYLLKRSTIDERNEE